MRVSYNIFEDRDKIENFIGRRDLISNLLSPKRETRKIAADERKTVREADSPATNISSDSTPSHSSHPIPFCFDFFVCL